MAPAAAGKSLKGG